MFIIPPNIFTWVCFLTFPTRPPPPPSNITPIYSTHQHVCILRSTHKSILAHTFMSINIHVRVRVHLIHIIHACMHACMQGTWLDLFKRRFGPSSWWSEWETKLYSVIFHSFNAFSSSHLHLEARTLWECISSWMAVQNIFSLPCLSLPFLSFLISLCHAMPYPVISYCITSCNIISRHATSCHECDSMCSHLILPFVNSGFGRRISAHCCCTYIYKHSI